MLNADVPVPNVYANKAITYGQIFHELLAAAAQKVSAEAPVTIESENFDVVKGEYPSSLADFDGIIISGSANSAYDDLDWIRRLDEYIEKAYHNEPSVKIYGSCFGHQLVCQSLLKNHGVRVEVDLNGWEIGVKEITFNPRFRNNFGKGSKIIEPGIEGVPDKMRLQFVHHDHVIIPSPLPPSWITAGSTEHCAVQGVYEPGRVLTLQGHFEFDKFVNSETVKFFFPTWDAQLLETILEAVDADDDAIAAAEMVLKFFMERGFDKVAATHRVAGGLLTPPNE